MKSLIFFSILLTVNALNKEDVCSLDPDQGGCASFTPLFFYNQYTGQCHEFVYRGCLGNKNQFESREECESFCEGMALEKKPDCHKKPEKGPCNGLIYRFYYDVDEQACKIFEYGGCRGNANNFRSAEECMDTCFEKADRRR